ncbi:unnamed protein product [Candidula unifasciata]|uniref:Endonuclease/exonuclease/phosphatase domain-containing protein n=1 Tax=Candidula unifasciata TaxID=100452 RepID=A0A8S3ZG38_9EUPU|nr:unnamed protein product [Candidula unifasciata]
MFTVRCFHILFLILATYSHAVSITVGSCNLWNVMFNWKTRVQHIADIIKENAIDIVAFQEVRLTEKEHPRMISSQVDEFKLLLPEYRWFVVKSAGVVAMNSDAYRTEWGQEGLAILSRKQILSSSVISMTKASSSDRNPRVGVQVKIRLGPDIEDVVDIIVVHFSYDRQQQCQNAVDVLKITSGFQGQNIIILGDFNIYPDFEAPVELFTSRRHSACSVSSSVTSLRGLFKDVWLSAGRRPQEGLTFSNMPTPGLVSRPDRILVSRNITVEDAGLAGNGTNYRKYYYQNVIISRAKTVLRTSFDAFMGRSGYSCLQDCGPHGSCRCGICISGGNQDNCNVPDCVECNSFIFVSFLVFLIPFAICLLVLFFSVLKILIVSTKVGHKDILELCGYRCCLFNKNLFNFPTVPRKYKIKATQLFCLCRLPPVLLLLVMLASLLVLLLLMRWFFHKDIQLIYSLLPEEMFPSDHLIVFTRLRL